MDETKKQNILVTGVSGYLGISLVKHLLKDGSLGNIYGTDISEPSISSSRFFFEKMDIRDKESHRELIQRNRISQVFHFAFVLGEVKDQDAAVSINVGGTRAIVEAANETSTVKRIIIAGSVSAYGADKANELYIKEDHPLNAATLRYGISKRLMEAELEKMKGSLRKDLKLALLRVCTIVGPTERNGGAIETFLSLPVGFSIIGHDCPIQFIHEKDLLDIFESILRNPRFSGIYNVAPRKFTTMREISRKLGKSVIPVPYSLLYGLFFIIFRIKPQMGVSENSVSYLAYPIIVDSSKIERDLGISFRYSSLDAFMSCANALKAARSK